MKLNILREIDHQKSVFIKVQKIQKDNINNFFIDQIRKIFTTYHLFTTNYY